MDCFMNSFLIKFLSENYTQFISHITDKYEASEKKSAILPGNSQIKFESLTKHAHQNKSSMDERR